MKLDGPQSFPICVLKGALVTNPNGGEFYINGVSVDFANHEIHIELEGGDEEKLFKELGEIDGDNKIEVIEDNLWRIDDD